MCSYFYKADTAYGQAVARAVGVDEPEVVARAAAIED
jgi:hypothetical protein